jgi:hypothetical protein
MSLKSLARLCVHQGLYVYLEDAAQGSRDQLLVVREDAMQGFMLGGWHARDAISSRRPGKPLLENGKPLPVYWI